MQTKPAHGAPDDSRLAREAAKQHGVVSVAQMHTWGFHRRAIANRVAAGRLHRIHRGVYAVGHTRLTLRGRFMAAVLACGRDAALSHQDAAVLHGLLRVGTGDIHVTAPTRHHLPGIRCHLAEHSDVTKIDGIPVTTLERTLLDLAATYGLKAALKQTQHEDKLDRRRLDALMARCPGHRGVGVLRSALADLTEEPGWTQSELERRFLQLCRDHQLPLPLTNQYVEGELVDAFWPEHGLIVEIDGWKTHKIRDSFESDRARDSKLTAAGYRVMRFTRRRLRNDAAAVADEVR